MYIFEKAKKRFPSCENLNIAQVYFPTSEAPDDEIEERYSQLLETLPNRETTMIIGDYNAIVGREVGDEHIRKVIDKYGLGERRHQRRTIAAILH
ncbi:hypothetical protein HUJ05_004842 [Dendroctonus ponderosae]|nr:hypothetical protein HUJ05_004842 [Dendroctonus ponderosae]